MEYWHSRLSERGNLLAHNVRDFEKLLRSHAKAWREQPKCKFDRDEWMAHSGAARRFSQDQVQNDLTEIEEGRFLQIAVDDSGAYEFRSEVLPYALGLLVNAELKEELGKGGDAAEQLGRIIDTIRGFDLVAEIVAAAVGLASLDDSFPPHGRAALVGAWLSLQNTDDSAADEMSSYVPVRPDAFLDAAEAPLDALGASPRYDLLSALLVYKRDHPAVRAALETRLTRWLGRWSRRATGHCLAGDTKDRQATHEAKIETNLASFSESERARFRELTVEVSDYWALRLDRLAVSLLAGWELKPFAAGLLGWALVLVVTEDRDSAYENLAWAVRLNSKDWIETRNAVWQLTEGVNQNSSNVMKTAAAIALGLVAGKDSSARSRDLQPPLSGSGYQWRLEENFCNTNPHDPNAPPGTNLDNARRAAAAIVPITIWVGMSRTAEDHQVELILPALARFDPEVIVQRLREILATALQRTSLQLRQLSWHAVELSPILDQSTLAALRDVYAGVIDHPDRVAEPHRNWVAASLARCLLPHLPPESQLEVLLRLPRDCPLYLSLRDGLRPLSAHALESRLVATIAMPQDLGRTLFFASGSKPELTSHSRQIIADCWNHAHETVSIGAADVILKADDADLYDLLLAQVANREVPKSNGYAAEARSHALAAAIISRGRQDLLDRLSPRILDMVAAKLGGQALETFSNHIDYAVHRLLKPVAAKAPHEMSILLAAQPEEFGGMRRVEDKSESRSSSGGRDIRSLFRQLDLVNDPEEASRRYNERQTQMIRELEAYEQAIVRDGAADMFSAPLSEGFDKLVSRCPERVLCWISDVLAAADDSTLGQVRNLGLSLARAYAANDGAKAADLFRHLKSRVSPVNVLVGHEEIPFYEYQLFSTADVEPIAALRAELVEEGLDDAVLQKLVAAAEVCNASAWLDRHIEQLATCAHPAAQARALTLAGFRQPNDTSERILNEDWGEGFLGVTAAAARKSYQRAGWACHWLERAASAVDPVDFWRFGTLASGVVDIRFVAWWCSLPTTELIKSYGADLHARLKRAATERLKKGRETLFGQRAPQEDIAILIRDKRS